MNLTEFVLSVPKKAKPLLKHFNVLELERLLDAYNEWSSSTTHDDYQSSVILRDAQQGQGGASMTTTIVEVVIRVEHADDGRTLFSQSIIKEVA